MLLISKQCVSGHVGEFVFITIIRLTIKSRIYRYLIGIHKMNNNEY